MVVLKVFGSMVPCVGKFWDFPDYFGDFFRDIGVGFFANLRRFFDCSWWFSKFSDRRLVFFLCIKVGFVQYGG